MAATVFLHRDRIMLRLTPSVLVWAPGLVSATGPLVTYQVNVRLVLSVPSEAVTVTLASAVLGHALQHDEGGVHAEATAFLFRALDHEGLEAREVMGQLREARGEQSRMFQLGGQELDGQRQARGGQDFLVNAFEDFLGRDVGGQALAHAAEEISLLDVLFAFEDRTVCHASIIAARRSRGQPARTG
jgi:hypothetical protein